MKPDSLGKLRVWLIGEAALGNWKEHQIGVKRPKPSRWAMIHWRQDLGHVS